MSDTINGVKRTNMCTGCGLCVTVCKFGAIRMQENEEGFLFPYIDEKKCVNCGMCARKCPVNATFERNEASFYMGWHKDKEILMSSSSGGAFTAIAEYVLEKDGAVFGASKDRVTKEITHKMVQTSNDLSLLRGSKYYQSDVKDAYKQVKERLHEGQYILFSGTSCQVAALYSYLGESNTDRLITVDVLCHGVTSKRVIEEYLSSQKKQYGKEIIDFSFRTKEGNLGWQKGYGTRMHLFFADGKEKVMEAPYDAFFLGFNSNFFLRESCYNCNYCGTGRVADFTLGDFWGCTSERVSAENMWYGVSLILANSIKAKEILPKLAKDMEIIPIDAGEAIPYNEALVKPQIRPAYRDTFFKILKRDGYQKSIQRKYPYRFIKLRIKNLLRFILPRKILVKIMKNA